MPFVNNGSDGKGEIITAGTLDAEVTSLTLDVRHLRQLTLFIALTRGGALTALIMSADCGPDGVNWFPLQNQDETPPDKALVPATKTKTTSITESWSFNTEVARLGGPFLRFRFTGTGGEVGDVLTVQAYGET